MEKYNINWLGVKYPAIDIVIFAGTKEELQVTVSTTALSDVLMQNIDSGIGADEATRLDETIAYYLEPDEFDLSETEIVEIVEANYS